ncbi:SRPBCC family protein [uncultured Massilia sp.]|uniref:SRPBCC family protein n=1 Tax=uncultured Massilia sp. TaxID=169973 RepID=UPI0025CBE59E|nr:SRPBCC family protein [uncultured Massilia sp.]
MRHTTDTRAGIGIDVATWLGGAAAGALLMYLLDPDRGGARRARSVAAVRGVGARSGDAVRDTWHDAGTYLGTAGALRPDGAAPAGGRTRDTAQEPDPVRIPVSGDAHGVRDALREAGAAIAAVAGPGPRRQGHDAHDTPRGAVHDAPAGTLAPAARHTALAGGALLAGFGLARRSPLGLVLGLAGAALLARGAANQPLGGVLRAGRQRLSLDQPVDVEQSVHIDAAPEDVYDLWTDYEHFPRFMSHVVEVRDLGRRRSHWVVKGPGGSHFSWNAVVTEQSRPHRLAWRSEPGAEIPQSGSIAFAPQRGGTLVTVRMSYTPPAGAIGHGLATLLGADPQSRLAQDLAAMKSFVERGALPHGGVRPPGASRYLH